MLRLTWRELETGIVLRQFSTLPVRASGGSSLGRLDHLRIAIFILFQTLTLICMEVLFAFARKTSRGRISCMVNQGFFIPFVMVLPEAEFWTYAPVKKTSFKECLGLEVSSPMK